MGWTKSWTTKPFLAPIHYQQSRWFCWQGRLLACTNTVIKFPLDDIAVSVVPAPELPLPNAVLLEQYLRHSTSNGNTHESGIAARNSCHAATSFVELTSNVKNSV